ncbi:unnamed protein product [Durusdinium trenchii]|uniref:Uncharacterized protein n=1 Tax=Durusdinium trenchii TaxID=1381693 RepID=A0ABP0L1S8_9DINO
MAYLSSEDLHAAASALAAAPLAQEFCLLCFFCLGFLLCRTSVVKRLLSLERFLGLELAQLAHPAVDRTDWWSRLPRIGSGTLLQLHQQRRYEEVLDAWPTLEDFTPQAFSAVVDALLALDRPEDVGLFFYKATVNLRHLRSSLHESIGKIEQSQVPLERISVALREVFENREPLDVRAWQELLVAFAKTNDTTYADALLDLCPEPLPLDILRRSVEGFLSCSNLEAAIRYLQKAEELHGLEGHFQDLVAETAYAVEVRVEGLVEDVHALGPWWARYACGGAGPHGLRAARRCRARWPRAVPCSRLLLARPRHKP